VLLRCESAQADGGLLAYVQDNTCSHNEID
jgi:hypothetical protein